MNQYIFFAVDDRKNTYKIGKTIDIINRLRVYNVGRIKDLNKKNKRFFLLSCLGGLKSLWFFNKNYASIIFIPPQGHRIKIFCISAKFIIN